MTTAPHADPSLERDRAQTDAVAADALEHLDAEKRLGADVMVARAGMSDHEYGRFLRLNRYPLSLLAQIAPEQDRDLDELTKGWYSTDTDGNDTPSTPEKLAGFCKRADNAWDEKRAGTTAKKAYDVLAAARKYETLERTLRAKSHAQVWARDNNRSADAARLGADIDRLYTEIGTAREDFLRMVSAAAPDHACCKCGSDNSRTEMDDDGPQDVEPHLRSPGKRWAVRVCVECERRERID